MEEPIMKQYEDRYFQEAIAFGGATLLIGVTVVWSYLSSYEIAWLLSVLAVLTTGKTINAFAKYAYSHYIRTTFEDWNKHFRPSDLSSPEQQADYRTYQDLKERVQFRMRQAPRHAWSLVRQHHKMWTELIAKNNPSESKQHS